MTNEELKAAIELFRYIEGITKEMPDNRYAKSQYNVILAARELSQLKDGTHPDMVMVPREPTLRMMEAGSIVKNEHSGGEYRYRIYKAMISAAPKGETK